MHSECLHKKARISVFVIALMIFSAARAQVNPNIEFGNNPAAGHYLAMKDSTRIYYELYGAGRPVVLLHGGLFGDISEYEKLIPKLAGHFQVIAIETRGHGKSYIGHSSYTYSLMAEDAYTIVHHITHDSVILIGFSDGAVTGMALTVAHPELVRKLVFAGGNFSPDDYKAGEVDKLRILTGATMEKLYGAFVKERKSIMPEPDRWDEFVELLKHAWLQPIYLDQSRVQGIVCPVLVAGGDRDQYIAVETSARICRMLPHSQLAIIPGSDHIIFYRRPDLMEALIMPFLLN